eukprot:10376411-Alexandrium_andersonii.AAC.2
MDTLPSRRWRVGSGMAGVCHLWLFTLFYGCSMGYLRLTDFSASVCNPWLCTVAVLRSTVYGWLSKGTWHPLTASTQMQTLA